jgi:hypothetical protein
MNALSFILELGSVILLALMRAARNLLLFLLDIFNVLINHMGGPV